MRRFSMRSTVWEKVRAIVRICRNDGVAACYRRYVTFIRSRAREQWEFVYFHMPVKRDCLTVPYDPAVTIRRAEVADRVRIETELFPFVGEKEANDKRYIALLGTPGVHCFVGEWGGRLVHYCWLFEDVCCSPLLDTPFDRRRIGEGDAYIGPAFTSPHARGRWIFPQSLSAIVSYLDQETSARRLLLFVHKDNPGAVRFFTRLGFQRFV